MFRRRANLSYLRRLREAMWPTMGFRRSTSYVGHRLGRLPGSPYSIAAGFAAGAAMSCTPLVGLHFVISAGLAWLIRANPLAALIGSVVGNPWTFPFIWIWTYELGHWMGAGERRDAGRLDFAGLFANMMHGILQFDIGFLFGSVWPVWWPMLLGSIPTAILVFFAFFLPLRKLIAVYQEARRSRVAEKRRLNERLKGVTR